MKKRGFGAGRWNGLGGKLEGNEALAQNAIRETKEEIGVVIRDFREVARLDFYFPEVPLEQDFNQQVVVFVADEWLGEPTESDEMRPEWFNLADIPYDQMWSDDKIWLPKVLAGEIVRAEFAFDERQEVAEFNLLPDAKREAARPHFPIK